MRRHTQPYHVLLIRQRVKGHTAQFLWSGQGGEDHSTQAERSTYITGSRPGESSGNAFSFGGDVQVSYML